MKKHILKTTLLLATLCCNITAFADNKVLTFATEATYPPFEYMDAKGNIEGFDADVLQAVCQQMQKQCKLVNQPFDSLIPSLKVGKFDGLIGALAITPEREQQVSFSMPYYQTTGIYVVAKDKTFPVTPEGMKGKTIGVQGSTALQFYLQGIYGDSVTIKSYPSEMQAFLDLKAGRVDAVLADTPLAEMWVKQENNAYITLGNPIVNEKYFGPGFGIAVNKNNEALLTSLNQALDTLQKNGTINKLAEKHFEQQ